MAAAKPATLHRKEPVVTAIAPFPAARPGLPAPESLRKLVRELARQAAREDFASCITEGATDAEI